MGEVGVGSGDRVGDERGQGWALWVGWAWVGIVGVVGRGWG